MEEKEGARRTDAGAQTNENEGRLRTGRKRLKKKGERKEAVTSTRATVRSWNRRWRETARAASNQNCLLGVSVFSAVLGSTVDAGSLHFSVNVDLDLVVDSRAALQNRVFVHSLMFSTFQTTSI